uniref:Uncharacterized protein n=1 Tax=Chromera velia CCMP2878 TaxID=1169474 RepID=A0A0G4GHJ8_9ALVE|eukprot:Cvel_669.t1-p1 / transcript=Cvel_669.t1 / gene=Cvel_669 / organism=Chromera_velia_CCMP2878 / gene_product=hypothetical protein / transcript_product=hypothetical protein / location=Cvel_scaffold20:193807-202292(-) / protein_length=1292 / sequence_SO=supercontig / SO=protein_coding / is_pseudo=false
MNDLNRLSPPPSSQGTVVRKPSDVTPGGPPQLNQSAAAVYAQQQRGAAARRGPRGGAAAPAAASEDGDTDSVYSMGVSMRSVTNPGAPLLPPAPEDHRRRIGGMPMPPQHQHGGLYVSTRGREREDLGGTRLLPHRPAVPQSPTGTGGEGMGLGGAAAVARERSGDPPRKPPQPRRARERVLYTVEVMKSFRASREELTMGCFPDLQEGDRVHVYREGDGRWTAGATRMDEWDLKWLPPGLAAFPDFAFASEQEHQQHQQQLHDSERDPVPPSPPIGQRAPMPPAGTPSPFGTGMVDGHGSRVTGREKEKESAERDGSFCTAHSEAGSPELQGRDRKSAEEQEERQRDRERDGGKVNEREGEKPIRTKGKGERVSENSQRNSARSNNTPNFGKGSVGRTSVDFSETGSKWSPAAQQQQQQQEEKGTKATDEGAVAEGQREGLTMTAPPHAVEEMIGSPPTVRECGTGFHGQPFGVSLKRRGGPTPAEPGADTASPSIPMTVLESPTLARRRAEASKEEEGEEEPAEEKEKPVEKMLHGGGETLAVNAGAATRASTRPVSAVSVGVGDCEPLSVSDLTRAPARFLANAPAGSRGVEGVEVRCVGVTMTDRERERERGKEKEKEKDSKRNVGTQVQVEPVAPPDGERERRNSQTIKDIQGQLRLARELELALKEENQQLRAEQRRHQSAAAKPLNHEEPPPAQYAALQSALNKFKEECEQAKNQLSLTRREREQEKLAHQKVVDAYKAVVKEMKGGSDPGEVYWSRIEQQFFDQSPLELASVASEAEGPMTPDERLREREKESPAYPTRGEHVKKLTDLYTQLSAQTTRKPTIRRVFERERGAGGDALTPPRPPRSSGAPPRTDTDAGGNPPMSPPATPFPHEGLNPQMPPPSDVGADEVNQVRSARERGSGRRMSATPERRDGGETEHVGHGGGEEGDGDGEFKEAKSEFEDTEPDRGGGQDQHQHLHPPVPPSAVAAGGRRETQGSLSLFMSPQAPDFRGRAPELGSSQQQRSLTPPPAVTPTAEAVTPPRTEEGNEKPRTTSTSAVAVLRNRFQCTPPKRGQNLETQSDVGGDASDRREPEPSKPGSQQRVSPFRIPSQQQVCASAAMVPPTVEDIRPLTDRVEAGGMRVAALAARYGGAAVPHAPPAASRLHRPSSPERSASNVVMTPGRHQREISPSAAAAAGLFGHRGEHMFAAAQARRQEMEARQTQEEKVGTNRETEERERLEAQRENQQKVVEERGEKQKEQQSVANAPDTHRSSSSAAVFPPRGELCTEGVPGFAEARKRFQRQ